MGKLEWMVYMYNNIVNKTDSENIESYFTCKKSNLWVNDKLQLGEEKSEENKQNLKRK